MKALLGLGSVALCAAVLALGLASPPAMALNPLGPVCSAAGWVSGIAGRVCAAAGHGRRLITAGTQLLAGGARKALTAVAGVSAGSVTSAVAGTMLTALVAWTIGGAGGAVRETARVLQAATTPQLTAPWFSTLYWRVAGVALLLTLPFLFAAAVQAVLRADLGLLARAALGYLPLATIGLALAAQLVALLLALTDSLCALLADAAGTAPGSLLSTTSLSLGAAALTQSPFVLFFVATFTVAGAVVLWLELLMRDAAVYVVVLLLPFAFSALVWPARRAWAIRAAELLVALVLSKVVVIAVLTLGAVAFAHSGSVTGMLTGLVLILLGAFAPWAMVRLVPFAELATSAVSHLRHETMRAPDAAVGLAMGVAEAGDDWARTAMTRMREEAARSGVATPGAGSGGGEPPSMQGAADVLGPGSGPEPGSESGPQPGAGPEPGAGPRLGPEPRPVGGPPAPSAAAGGRAPGASASVPDPEAPDAPSQRERLPGLGPMWQAPDFSWEPLSLAPEAGPQRELWTPPAVDDGQPAAQKDAADD